MIPGSAAILLSRQALRPSGRTPWVVQTVRAVKFAKANGWSLCSSCGMQTWELVTALASAEQIALRLYIPDGSDRGQRRRELSSDFCLNPEIVEFEFITGKLLNGAEVVQIERDRRVFEDAEILIPVSIREGGILGRLLEQYRAQGRKVIEDFRISYISREEPIAYHVETSALTHDIGSLSDEYITHWTRGSNHAWPGEKLSDYYAEIVRSERYPRSAFDTLRRIVSKRRIAASSRHMPGRISTVSFSELAPTEVLPLMRWRSRYRQMSFEPYGVGIRRAVAERCGVLPVRYFNKGKISALADCPEWLTQSVGEKSDWRQEQEYRHLGDFTFPEIPGDDLVLFCHTRKEASQLEGEFKLRAIPFVG